MFIAAKKSRRKIVAFCRKKRKEKKKKLYTKLAKQAKTYESKKSKKSKNCLHVTYWKISKWNTKPKTNKITKQKHSKTYRKHLSIQRVIIYWRYTRTYKNKSKIISKKWENVFFKQLQNILYYIYIYKVYQKPTNFKVLHTYEHFLQTSYTRKSRKTTTKATAKYKQLNLLRNKNKEIFKEVKWKLFEWEKMHALNMSEHIKYWAYMRHGSQ